MSNVGLPARVLRMLRGFGTNIGIARKRRGLTAVMMAERIGISRDTYARLERGDPSVALGTYATAIFVLGLDADFASLVDPQTDDVGTVLDLERLPKRVRARRLPQPK